MYYVYILHDDRSKDNGTCIMYIYYMTTDRRIMVHVLCIYYMTTDRRIMVHVLCIYIT